MCVLVYPEEAQTFKANSLSGAFTPHPHPSSEFTVKVFLNFSVPAPCPSPQESAQSAADSAPPGPSPGPSDFHPIRRPPHRKQRLPLGRPGARGSAPGAVCEWGEGRGRGGPEPCEPDASSGELRDSEALLCAPSRRAAAGGGRRGSRAGASRGWRSQAQAAGTGPSQLRTQCNWISEKNSLGCWLQGADRTPSENHPFGRNLGPSFWG